MSYYSDYKCGAITEDEYISCCEREDKMDRYAREKEEEREIARDYIREAVEKALNDIGLDLVSIELDGTTVTLTCEGDTDYE